MADKIQFQLTGGKEIIALFNALPFKVASKLVAPVLTATAKPLVAAAKRRVPKETRTLEKSLGSFMRRKRQAGVRLLVIGARTDAATKAGKERGGSKGGASRWWGRDDEGNIRKPENYSHLVEFGTVFEGPQPFLRPALDQHGQQAIDLGLGRMRKGIEREATKLSVTV